VDGAVQMARLEFLRLANVEQHDVIASELFRDFRSRDFRHGIDRGDRALDVAQGDMRIGGIEFWPKRPAPKRRNTRDERDAEDYGERRRRAA
jgi:hypothetical protein